jgi:DNA-binding transcriptional LysR family regulator
MSDANDQMLRLGGSVEGPRPLRFGISASMVKQFLRKETAETLAGIIMHTDNSLRITKGLMDGYTDVGCICENLDALPDISDMIVNEREETFVWVRSKDFVLSPGAPIPLLTGPGDDVVISTLTKQGIIYKIVFKGSDCCAKMAALEQGIGLAGLPSSMIPSSLIEAKEYRLPALPRVKVLLYARPGLENPQTEKLIRRLSDCFFNQPNTAPQTEPSSAKSSKPSRP